MLRILPPILGVLLLVLGPASAAAPSSTLAAEEHATPTLDQLFAKLATAGASPAGKSVEFEILKRFNSSGSDTADLLLAWAVQAIEAKKYPQALDILDQIVVLKPDFAEAWNKRATVNYIIDDYAASLSDIRRTLALEPRHFGALSGLGMMLQSMDRKDEAIRVYQKALAIDPQLDRVRHSLEELQKEASGNET